MFESDDEDVHNDDDDFSFCVDDPPAVPSSSSSSPTRPTPTGGRYSLGEEEEGKTRTSGNAVRSIFDIDDEEEEEGPSPQQQQQQQQQRATKQIPDRGRKRPSATDDEEGRAFKVPPTPPPSLNSQSKGGGKVSHRQGHLCSPQANEAPKRRKFPGPAGSLPRIATTDKFLRKLYQPAQESGDDQRLNEQQRQQQQHAAKDGGFVESDAWRKMLQDREVQESDPKDMINRYNVAWIKGGSSRLGDSKRAPALTCVLRQITDRNALDPRCSLQDRTGRVEATIHRAVVEKYGPYMHPGTVLVLRNTNVIWGATRKPLVIVTLDNLVAMYRQRDGSAESSSADSVRLVTKEELEEITRLSEEFERKMVQDAKARQEARSAAAGGGGGAARQMPPSFRPVQCSTPLASGPSLFSPDNHRFHMSSPSQSTFCASPSLTPVSGWASSVTQNVQRWSGNGNQAAAVAMGSSSGASSKSFGGGRPPGPPPPTAPSGAVNVPSAGPVQGNFVFRPNLPDIVDASRSASIFSSQNCKDLSDRILSDTLDGLDEESLFGDF